MFKRTRDRIVREVTAAVTEALKEQHASAKPSDLDSIGKFYADTLGGMGAFLNRAGDLAISGAAALMGQKGGRAKARNRAAKKAEAAAAPVRKCPLCRDSGYRNVTVDMILEHRKHEDLIQIGPPNGNGASEPAPEQQGAE